MTETFWLILAVAFGLGFNAWTKQPKRNKGFMSLWVAFGVLVALLLAALVPDSSGSRLALYWSSGEKVVLSNHAHAVIYVFKFFAATGTPMIIGSLWRNVQEL